jgi:hypothetical protein
MQLVEATKPKSMENEVQTLSGQIKLSKTQPCLTTHSCHVHSISHDSKKLLQHEEDLGIFWNSLVSPFTLTEIYR